MIELETKEAVEYVLEKYNSNLNKNRLAKMLGISNQAINNYIKYDFKMSLIVADKMLELFEIKVSDVKYFNRALTVYELENGVLTEPEN